MLTSSILRLGCDHGSHCDQRSFDFQDVKMNWIACVQSVLPGTDCDRFMCDSHQGSSIVMSPFRWRRSDKATITSLSISVYLEELRHRELI